MVYLYKKTCPSINDIVFANISEINQYNVVASLPYYNDLKAYISYTELSKKKRYNLAKIVNVGKQIVAVVTAINNDYVELSLRLLNDKDVENFKTNHKNYLNIYNFWKHIYLRLNPSLNMNALNIDENELHLFMSNTLWYIEEHYDNFENYTKLYEDLINSNTNSNIIDLLKISDIDNIKNIINDYIAAKAENNKPKVQYKIKLTSYEIDGSNDIKKALDYEKYDIYKNINQDYDISITYQCDSCYSINISQKNIYNNLYDVDKVQLELNNEIINLCKMYNIYCEI